MLPNFTFDLTNEASPIPKKAHSKSGEYQISIDNAWALVAMADRINDGKYVKQLEYVVRDNQVTNEILYYPNRELIRQSIDTGTPSITDVDRSVGEKMAEHFQGLVLTMLGETPNEFDQKVFQIIQQPTVGHRTGMAYMASLGQRYHREITQEKNADFMQALNATSTYQGQINCPLYRRLFVISKFAGRTFPGSVVRATDGYNLYFWTSSKLVDHWPVNKDFEINAVVKAHSADNKDNCKETRLTRVKITKF